MAVNLLALRTNRTLLPIKHDYLLLYIYVCVCVCVVTYFARIGPTVQIDKVTNNKGIVFRMGLIPRRKVEAEWTGITFQYNRWDTTIGVE
jgi:hypothetical protein